MDAERKTAKAATKQDEKVGKRWWVAERTVREELGRRERTKSQL